MDWSPAVPILAGGLVAIAAGAVTQYFAHRLTRQREAEKLRREKAEELLHTLFAHLDWLDTKVDALMQQASYDVPSPLQRAYAIQCLHFPELQSPLRDITTALKPLLTLLSTQRQAQLRDFQTWQATFDPGTVVLLQQTYIARE